MGNILLLASNYKLHGIFTEILHHSEWYLWLGTSASPVLFSRVWWKWLWFLDKDSSICTKPSLTCVWSKVFTIVHHEGTLYYAHANWLLLISNHQFKITTFHTFLQADDIVWKEGFWFCHSVKLWPAQQNQNYKLWVLNFFFFFTWIQNFTRRLHKILGALVTWQTRFVEPFLTFSTHF